MQLTNVLLFQPREEVCKGEMVVVQLYKLLVAALLVGLLDRRQASKWWEKLLEDSIGRNTRIC